MSSKALDIKNPYKDLLDNSQVLLRILPYKTRSLKARILEHAWLPESIPARTQATSQCGNESFVAGSKTFPSSPKRT